ncbi:hypothetical protein HMI54_008038, partial [Coelomomyces lativittatus]
SIILANPGFIYEFRGLYAVERFFTYFLALLLLPATFAFGQRSAGNAVIATFPDSVKSVLDKTRNADAINVGAEFVTAWNTLSADQQQTVRKQKSSYKNGELMSWIKKLTKMHHEYTSFPPTQ